MNTANLQRGFAKMGADLLVKQVSQTGFRLDIVSHKKGEVFLLEIDKEIKDQIIVYATDIQPKLRHLVMVVSGKTEDFDNQTFLCGHDERHWFAANVSNGINKVQAAMNDLKPNEVTSALLRKKVPKAKRNKRHNSAFKRQGEWFFMPAPKVVLDERFIRFNEPLTRSWRSKPHIIEEVIRTGGERVWICTKYPNGISKERYLRLIRKKPKAKSWGWRELRRNPNVFGRGKVKHPDHATIYLNSWHKIVMNSESVTENLTFLD